MVNTFSNDYFFAVNVFIFAGLLELPDKASYSFAGFNKRLAEYQHLKTVYYYLERNSGLVKF
jgi:hypothetical protein